MKMRSWQIGVLLLANALMTIITAGVVGPSPQKLANLFGLVAWAGRAPFYLLPLYLTPLTLWLRPTIIAGALVGVGMGLPLALWAKAAHCPLPVQLTYLVSGFIQGGILSYLMRRFVAGGGLTSRWSPPLAGA